MKTRYLLILLGAAALSATAQENPASALVQELPDAKVDILFSDKGGDLNVYEIFKENAPKEFHAPKVPRFAIKGKDNKFIMGIGTQIKAVGLFDWGNPIASPDYFAPSAIEPVAAGDGGKTRMTFNQSSIYLNFVGLPGTDNQVGGYINAYFLGPNNNFAIQYAYIKYRGIQVGYYTSLFSDAAACPPTIDFEGPNAYTCATTYGISYTRSFGKGWQAAIGLEMPGDMISCSYGASTRSVSQRIPTIPLYIQYSFSGGSYLRLAGLVRNLQYRDLTEAKNRDKAGWGIALSGTANITPSLCAYYQGAYGKGMSSYIQDLAGLGLDLSPCPGEPGRMAATEAWGAYGGLQYTFSPRVFCSATYSHVRAYPKVAASDQYSYGQYVVANVFYNVTSYFQTGIEYLWGRRVDMNGAQCHDNRINLQAQLTF